MFRTPAFFLYTKTIISRDKNGDNGSQILHFPWKTSAAPRQRGYIMAQVGVHAFYRESIVFIVDIINMLSRKHNVQIPAISICTVCSCFRRLVYDLLNRLRRFVHTDAISRNLSRLSTNHRYNIDVFPRVCTRLLIDEPV